MRKKLKKDAQGFYLLKHGDQVAREHAPPFAKRSIEIKLAVTRGREKGGVLISHGGSRSGYSLYLEDGKPVFSCRLGGTLHTFRATKAMPESRVSLSATLLPDGKVSLIMENEVVAEGKLPGLFNTHPQDPLEIGDDSLSTVASYPSSPRFKGKVNEAKLKLK